MAAPKGNNNGEIAWFPSPEEPKVYAASKVPKSIYDRLNELLKPGESRSAAIVAAIELLIRERSQLAQK
ncbi:hypothetical protein [Microcoleus anatoxicus]|uniref:CopG-like ribbon-helix-helix domain-containing protein n=1 Tax=Microcoleus anatoxicus PTRS2 TaxID=2705321 RepID=A0ABU8YKB4_9CYAN